MPEERDFETRFGAQREEDEERIREAEREVEERQREATEDEIQEVEREIEDK